MAAIVPARRRSGWALLLAAAATAAGAEPGPPTVAQLQAAYLQCDRVATQRVLDGASAAYCSTVAETLRVRGFGGSFERMLAWWRDARAVTPTAAPPTAAPPAAARR